MQRCPTELPPERLSGLSPRPEPIFHQTEAWAHVFCVQPALIQIGLGALPWDSSLFTLPLVANHAFVELAQMQQMPLLGIAILPSHALMPTTISLSARCMPSCSQVIPEYRGTWRGSVLSPLVWGRAWVHRNPRKEHLSLSQGCFLLWIWGRGGEDPWAIMQVFVCANDLVVGNLS